MVVGKRELVTRSKAMIFDVEGTTTSISFVKDKLFPYVRDNVKEFLERHWNEEEFKDVLTMLKDQAKLDVSNSVEGASLIPEDGSDGDVQEALMKNVLWQMDCDAKTLALKNLQGHIMREGYKQGQLKGHLYSDVVPCLRGWSQSGLKLFVYSSGSVEAQKLLFSHSQEGDVLDLFEGHFDTTVGRKTDAASYADIAKQLGYQPDEMVFFTDIPKEASAAVEAGLTSVLVSREGNAELTENDRSSFQVINTFEDFECELPAKRRKVSVEVEETKGDVSVVTAEEAPKEVPAADVEDVDMKDVSEMAAVAQTDVDKTEMEVNVQKTEAVAEEKVGSVVAASVEGTDALVAAATAVAAAVVKVVVAEIKPTESATEVISDEPTMNTEVEVEPKLGEKIVGALDADKNVQAEDVSKECASKEEPVAQVEVVINELLKEEGAPEIVESTKEVVKKIEIAADEVESKNDDAIQAVSNKENTVEDMAVKEKDDQVKEVSAGEEKVIVAEADVVVAESEVAEKEMDTVNKAADAAVAESEIAVAESEVAEKEMVIVKNAVASEIDVDVPVKDEAKDAEICVEKIATQMSAVVEDIEKGQGDGPHVTEKGENKVVTESAIAGGGDNVEKVPVVTNAETDPSESIKDQGVVAEV